MLHAIGRAILHFFSAPGILLAGTFALAVLCRKRPTWTWLPQSKKQIIVVAAICVFAGSALREAWDVSQGQTVAKAISDYISWAAGCSVGTWALFRLEKWQ